MNFRAGHDAPNFDWEKNAGSITARPSRNADLRFRPVTYRACTTSVIAAKCTAV